MVEESSDTYMDTDKRFVELPGDGKEVLWGSERDGWSHLYLYDGVTGQLKNRVTGGEFVKANKDFDLIIVPNADHGGSFGGPYVTRKRWDFFVRHLLGIEPPKEYKITSFEKK